MRLLSYRFLHLLRDTAGNILPLAAVGMMVAAAVVGSGIDLSRDYKVRNQLQAACDAAVLAGRRTVTTAGFDTASQTAANNYFATNFDSTSQEVTGTSFVAASTDGGKTVTGTATTTLNTLVMRLFGFNTFTVSVSCASSMGVGNADVMMVLDTTGSMGQILSGSQTRLAALQQAMKDFYTTLADATAATNARIRYGFVPYSTTVNVGKLVTAVDPSYIADTWTYQTKTAIYIDYSSATKSSSSTTYGSTSTGSLTQYSNTSYNNSSTCQNNLPTSTTWGDSGSESVTLTVSGTSPNLTVTRKISQGQTQRTYSCAQSGSKYKIYYQDSTRTETTNETWTGAKTVTGTPTANSEYYQTVYQPWTLATDVFKTGDSATLYTGTNGTAVSSTWDGCILERSTVATSSISYNSVTGISPSSAYDIDLDTIPSNDATRWGPLWPEAAYMRCSSGTCGSNNMTYASTTNGKLATSPCPAQGQLLTEMSQSAFNTYANSLVANGNTYLDIGMIWGGRMISPEGIFQDNVNTEAANGGEVSRHLIFMTDGEMQTVNYYQQAWGMEYWDRKVASDGSSSTETANHTKRFLAVCEAIKAKGIRLWVIAFTSTLSSDLTTCASANSSYTAANATELSTAFQEIAKQVGELRLTQ
ncbi:pilus assembly protein TadG [Novosphingobium sp. KA1]|nr:pilus assembly protein TadG [Novosphingobium sp. KA1]